MKHTFSSLKGYLWALGVGLFFSYFPHPIAVQTAEFVSTVFLKILRLLASPLIFLSVVSSLLKLKSFAATKKLGSQIFRYTILTTFLSAALGLILYLSIGPSFKGVAKESSKASISYVDQLTQMIPDNFVGAFYHNQVLGIVLIAAAIGIAGLSLKKEQKHVLETFFSALFSVSLKVAFWIAKVLPIGVAAFIIGFFHNWNAELSSHGLGLYALIILGANLIQGFVVLPLFLLWKKLSPQKVCKAMAPAIITAFFTKSSNAALPFSLERSQNVLGIKKRVSSFGFPLCAVVNMNGCAAFILITLCFVSQSYGMIWSFYDYAFWLVVACLAAIGNAGIPMGCYFLTSAFLTSMGISLEMMGWILPLYAFFDMVETALNVWSDSCVVAAVDQDFQHEPLEEEDPSLSLESPSL